MADGRERRRTSGATGESAAMNAQPNLPDRRFDSPASLLIRLQCAQCRRPFDKPANEYRRCVKEGQTVFYCSRRCSLAVSNKGVAMRAHLLRVGRRGKVADELSPFRWFVARARNRKKRKGETDLTAETLRRVWVTQAGICPFSGRAMILPTTTDGWSTSSPWERESR